MFTNLLDPQNVGSGLAEKLLLAPLSFFQDGGIKDPEPPYLYVGAQVTILESHEFKPGKGFIEFLLPPDKNSLTAKSIGDIGAKKLQQVLNCFLSGSYSLLHETIKNLLNQPLIVLIEDSECGANLYYQLGCEGVPAYLKADFNTGTNVDGTKGYEVSIDAVNGYVKIYAGAVSILNPGAILYLGKEEEDGAILTEDGFQILL